MFIRWTVICLLLSPVAASPQDETLPLEHWSGRGYLDLPVFSAKKAGSLKLMVGGLLPRSGPCSLLCAAEALEGSGLDAVAVGYEDLRPGVPGLAEFLASPKIPFLCANVKGAGRSHVVRQVGKTRVGLVSVTKPPAYRKSELPQGWTIDDPASVLKELLPKLAKEADLIVLLAVMDRIECAALLKEIPGIHVALVPGVSGNDPEPLPIGGSQLISSPRGPGSIARLSLKGDAKKGIEATNRIDPLSLSEKELEAARTLLARHREASDADRLLAASAPGAAVPPKLPSSLEPGAIAPLEVTRSDRSVEMRFHSIRSMDSYGGRKAPERSRWLAVDTEWKNIIPLSFVVERDVSTTYAIVDATNNIYLVINGKTLSRLDPDLSGGAGGLLDKKSITLPTFRSSRRGNLVFPIPASGVETLDLYFYDFQHGHVHLRLLEPAEGQRVEPKPVTILAKNEILEAGVYRISQAKSGDPSAPGTILIFDLRARSLATVEADATAFDPKAKPGEKARLGIAGDIEEAWKGLRLVADDGTEYGPLLRAGLPSTPRFLPEAMTGWDVPILVPEKTVAKELRWTFPDIGMPDGRVVKPAPLRIPISGRTNLLLCPKCGQEATSTDKFCGKCGTKLGQ